MEDEHGQDRVELAKRSCETSVSDDSGVYYQLDPDGELLMMGNTQNFVPDRPSTSKCHCQYAGKTDLDEIRFQLEKNQSMLFDLKNIVDSCFTLSNDHDKAASLLPVASRLRMPALTRECQTTLKRHLSINNSLKTYRLAQETENVDELKNECEKFILKNFKQVWQDSEIVNLSVQEMVTFLYSDLLVVGKEEIVFQAIQRWIEADLANRKKHLNVLMETLRLNHCQTDFIRELLEHPLLVDSPCILSRINAELSKLEHKQDQEQDETVPKPRPSHKEELVIFAIGGRTSSIYDEMSFEILDPDTKKWIFRHDVENQPRGETLVVPMQDEIFVLELDSELVRSFNPLTLTWRSHSSLPMQVKGVSLAAIGNNVYIMGGYSYMTVTNRCFVYHYDEDRWEIIPDMKYSRSRSSATVLKGRIYCSGGRDHNHITINFLESIVPEEENWMDENPMIHCRWGHALVSCSSYLWAFGGCNITQSLNEVERYNPDTRQWTLMSPMQFARRSLSVTIYNGKFYALGGIDRGTPMVTTEVYDPELSIWEKNADLTIARGVLGSCVFKIGSYEQDVPYPLKLLQEPVPK